ncbi:microtubule-associated protein 9 isoform X2 [Eucyclogobius newberryi]|uniref:microtubule-associated protein 9 isoform X2 n=1 Tax=Eucyclogobius newberryi TaxID=166745 RepID=UPI003B5BB65B
MTNQELGTLAYSKSPKTSSRTKFQEELQAAVSSRANRVIMDQYSDDFDNDEDEFLNELLNSRKKKANAFKARRAKTVNFEFSDDEDKPVTSKRVSFLKTQRTPPADSPTDEKNNDKPDESGDRSSFSSQHLTQSDQSSEKISDMDSSHSQDTQETTNRSVSPPSGDALQDMPPLLPSHLCENTTVAEKKELPIPKPRQRVMAVTNLPQDVNMSFASTTSEPSNQHNTSGFSPNFSEGTPAALGSTSQSLSSTGEHSVLTKSTTDSGSKNVHNPEDAENHFLSSEELTISQPSPTREDSVNQADCSTNLGCPISDDTLDTLNSGSRAKGSRGGSAKTVESKYLGSLRILDRTFSLQDTEPQADSLRAAVYQEWVKKKKVSLKQSMEMKKKEETIKEKKKKDQEAKREDAVASYEAWKEKKLESIKAKSKEQREQIRKEQRAREEIEEKRQTSKQLFEKWKHEHDLLLKEKYIKARKDETELKLQEQEKEEERKQANVSAFSEWNKKKKNTLQERAVAKCKELGDTSDAERNLKEQKDKMALDMYESWLTRKILETKRHKEERWFQEILHDGNSPPPWSPPNKTIPRGK